MRDKSTSITLLSYVAHCLETCFHLSTDASYFTYLSPHGIRSSCPYLSFSFENKINKKLFFFFKGKLVDILVWQDTWISWTCQSISIFSFTCMICFKASVADSSKDLICSDWSVSIWGSAAFTSDELESLVEHCQSSSHLWLLQLIWPIIGCEE